MKLDKFNLENKNIIITGAAGLLGFEHTVALLNCGARVIMTDIDLKKLNENKKKLLIKNKLHRVDCYKMDVGSEKSIQNIIKILTKKKIKIDVLINNACLNPKYSKNFSNFNNKLENFSINTWNKEILIGLTGAFSCSKIIGTYMKKNKTGGVILNISSELSIISPDQRIYISKKHANVKPVTYSVIKTGLIGLTRYLATYWLKENIRCNALSPGGVEENQSKEFKNKIKKLIPMGRMAKKNEYHSAVQFLCSDASSYMNGQNMVVDGGRSIW